MPSPTYRYQRAKTTMVRREAHSPSKDLSDNQEIRLRVKKACERCRLRKCKCDGASPCGRCLSDNLICGYKKRRKSTRSVYQPEYVQMLERNQLQLTAGVQELYKRLHNGHGLSGQWPNGALHENTSTNKILDGLGILNSTEWDDFDDSESTYKSSEEYSLHSKTFAERKVSSITGSEIPAAQRALSRAQAATEMRDNIQTDTVQIQADALYDQTLSISPFSPSLPCLTYSPAFAETLCQFQQKTIAIEVDYFYSEDKCGSGVDMHLSADADCPIDWSTHIIPI